MKLINRWYTFFKRAWFLCFILLLSTALFSTSFPQVSTAYAQGITNSQQNNQVWLPLVQSNESQKSSSPSPAPAPVPASASEWTQDAHDAQHTGYTQEVPQTPWTLAWTWNGPDSNGGTGGHFYDAPRSARTVTGGSYVYVPAGKEGLYALKKSDGSEGWHRTETSFNAAPAYHAASGYLLAGGEDGTLYKINSETGQITGTYQAGSPLSRSIILAGNYAYAVSENGDLHKVEIDSMKAAWVYSAGSDAATPPAYSASTGLIVYATADLNVHAVKDADGSRQWKVKPTSHSAEYPYTFDGYWPVIAEQNGLVFLRLNLGMDALWSGPLTGDWGGGVYPETNSDIRALLKQDDGSLENLFALRLSDGSKAFTPAVGFGGVEALLNDKPVLESGPMPVIRPLSEGGEVAYLQFRNGQGSPHDGRWDSHMGEMVLDNDTISSLSAGDMRFVDFPGGYANITDEQTPLTMAGDVLFQAHWGASEAIRITDRSSSLGLNHDQPINAEALPTVIRRMQECSSFDPSTHWTTCGLTLFDDGRYWPGPGFWVYWNVLDPPTPDRSAYSEGILPRYTYVSDGLIIVEGNGGDIFVLRHSG